MTIQARIVADSTSPMDVRITTFVLTYPRFIHAEFMTHRVFSRNASSSRAIPVAKQIQMVVDDPAIPLAFTRNKAGMQGGEALSGGDHERAVKAWLDGRDRAVATAKALEALEVHKQYANRVIEPYSHISVVCTATDWDNFFALRYHSMAQPEICELAKQMWEEYNDPELVIEQLDEGEWHLPFVSEEEREEMMKYTERKMMPNATGIQKLLMMSTARCARVSYLNHEGKKPTLDEDIALYNRLVGGHPIHASPAEHQAMAIGDASVRSGNFRGWIQHRKTLPGENITRFDGPTE